MSTCKSIRKALLMLFLLLLTICEDYTTSAAGNNNNKRLREGKESKGMFKKFFSNFFGSKRSKSKDVEGEAEGNNLSSVITSHEKRIKRNRNNSERAERKRKNEQAQFNRIPKNDPMEFHSQEYTDVLVDRNFPRV